VAGATGWYDAHAPDLVRRYEAINPVSLHGWLSGLLPDAPGTVLDIGAGSGRDAGWFSAQGPDVIAVEPGRLRDSPSGLGYVRGYRVQKAYICRLSDLSLLHNSAYVCEVEADRAGMRATRNGQWGRPTDCHRPPPCFVRGAGLSAGGNRHISGGTETLNRDAAGAERRWIWELGNDNG
jgi:hypothetical protein